MKDPDKPSDGAIKPPTEKSKVVARPPRNVNSLLKNLFKLD